jgi:flagellin-like protein
VFEIMAFTKKNEEAVSPVIGVILMVAITVILAAVIAAFVFGMAGNISKTKVVAVTVQRTTSTQAQVTNMGGQDVTSLNSITVTGGTSDTNLGKTVGKTATVSGIATTKAHIIATGYFTDGSYQVLLDTYI